VRGGRRPSRRRGVARLPACLRSRSPLDSMVACSAVSRRPAPRTPSGVLLSTFDTVHILVRGAQLDRRDRLASRLAGHVVRAWILGCPSGGTCPFVSVQVSVPVPTPSSSHNVIASDRPAKQST